MAQLRAPVRLRDRWRADDLEGDKPWQIVLQLLWAYLASIAILLGAEFNAILRERREARRATAVGFPSPSPEGA